MEKRSEKFLWQFKLEKWILCHQFSLSFSWVIKTRKIHELVVEAYKESGPCASTVRKWAIRFRKGRKSVVVHRQGRPQSTEGLASAIMKKLDEQPFSSLRTLAADLGYSRETIRLCLKHKNQISVVHAEVGSLRSIRFTEAAKT